MALLDDEFVRIQTQLLDLKTDKYSLEEDGRRKDREISSLKQKLEELEKDLSKSQNLAKLNPLSFAKSLANKKQESKENAQIEQLSNDNDHLLRKIEAQEEEFKITNQTLKGEIALLMETNHKLVREVNALKGLPDDYEDESISDGPVEADLGKVNMNNERSLSYAFLAEKDALNSRIHELNSKVTELTEKCDKLQSECSDLEKVKREHSLAMSQLNQVVQESENKQSMISELQLAVNELKERLISDKSELESNREKAIKQIELEKQSITDELNSVRTTLSITIENLEATNEDLVKQLSDAEAVLDKLHETEKVVEKLKGDVIERDEVLQQANSEFDNRIVELESEKEKAILLMTETHECEIKELREQIKSKDVEKNLCEIEIEKSKQEIKDAIEERKIHEKKAMMTIKDLKRQFNNEKKRADKLQEKLKEFLNETLPSDLSSSRNTSFTSQNHETSSVGSWSYVDQATNKASRTVVSNLSDENVRTGSNVNSPNASGDHGPDGDDQSVVNVLELENGQLVSRLTKVQQEKWSLEEKINQLEVHRQSLIAELNSKAKLIEYYCMEGRSDVHHHHHLHQGSPMHQDKLTVKRVVDFIKDKGDENAKEINRKLQRMLEETLTKNMHLQSDLERLSNELFEVKSATGSA
ncbi:GRIP1-associated protein 1 [Halotydeus destructor]|nr:GRIP1-associated protein 1 [Halotydeus destructor]